MDLINTKLLSKLSIELTAATVDERYWSGGRLKYFNDINGSSVAIIMCNCYDDF